MVIIWFLNDILLPLNIIDVQLKILKYWESFVRVATGYHQLCVFVKDKNLNFCPHLWKRFRFSLVAQPIGFVALNFSFVKVDFQAPKKLIVINNDIDRLQSNISRIWGIDRQSLRKKHGDYYATFTDTHNLS